MHPPEFYLGQLMSEWPDCFLEVHCCQVPQTLPIRLLLQKHRDRSFEQLLKTLRCSTCGNHPAPVYLLASNHREKPMGGGKAGWSIEIKEDPQRYAKKADSMVTQKQKFLLRLEAKEHPWK